MATVIGLGITAGNFTGTPSLPVPEPLSGEEFKDDQASQSRSYVQNIVCDRWFELGVNPNVALKIHVFA
jgi:hypothetical protein